ELVFDGCRVTEDHMLGVRGEGFKLFLRILDEGGIAIAALGVGLAQACLDASVAYACERRAFGGPIGRYQSIAFKCADMAVAVENARNLTYKAARLRDRGEPFRAASAMAKLYSSEIAVSATREAVQIPDNVLSPKGKPGAPANYLIIGSDSRNFVDTPEEAKAFGTAKDLGAGRSDVMMVVHTEPKLGTAFVVSFPRDTEVEIPGHGRD